MLKWNVDEVPYYAHYPSRIDDAPFIDALTVRTQWEAFTRRGAERLLGSARKTMQRYSSGSTAGAKLRSVVEREVGDRRRGYENVVTRGATLLRSKVLLSRPENIDVAWRGGVSVKRGAGWRAISPGPDPSAIADADMDRVIELLVREDPECIEGDPAYLSGLARRCLVHGVELRRLSQVIVNHAFCWRVYADPIERAFRRRLRSNLATSEFGIIALSCDEGRLHLLETVYFSRSSLGDGGPAQARWARWSSRRSTRSCAPSFAT
jgi:hypothetical protein